MKRLALAVLLAAAVSLPAGAQSYYDIGVDLPAYPEMEPVPESPVYYAPGVESNYFFYDGLYWDFYNDSWYSSAWYNGPWEAVDPVYVPTYVLWVPIRYYRRPPGYFRNWQAGRPPRWSEHWGREWQQRHNAVFTGRGNGVPARAPLPAYQRQFSGANYPRAPQQQNALHAQRYGYQPNEPVVQQHYQNRGMAAPQPQQAPQRAPATSRPEQGGQSPGDRHEGRGRADR
jgi:hypothetical protein